MPPLVGFRSVLWFSILTTAFLGLLLRWALAGVPLPMGGQYAFFKHAHSHLGFFGILFPVVWASWKERDRFFLSPLWSGIYILGLILSTAGFLRAGYVVESIVGSTLVGVVWLVSAWKRRSWLLAAADWGATAPIGILLASLCIPPIALLTRRDPALAVLFVRTFLSLLLFLVALPAVLERLRLPPPRQPFWFLGGVASSLFLGVLPWPSLGLGLPLLAACLLFRLSAWRSLPWEITGLWLLWSIAACLLGFQILPNSLPLGIAGLHFTLLGPFLVSAAWGLAPPLPPLWLRYPYFFFLLLMVASIALQHSFLSPLVFLRLSALSGSFLSLWLLFLGLFFLRRSSSTVLGATSTPASMSPPTLSSP